MDLNPRIVIAINYLVNVRSSRIALRIGDKRIRSQKRYYLIDSHSKIALIIVISWFDAVIAKLEIAITIVAIIAIINASCCLTLKKAMISVQIYYCLYNF